MIERPVSEELIALLRRQELREATAGTEVSHLMKWANDLLDREEKIETGHSPTSGEGFRPMRIPVAGGTKPPALVGSVNTQEPSPARSRPVRLRLVASNRQRGAQRRTDTPPCLVLIIGGKA